MLSPLLVCSKLVFSRPGPNTLPAPPSQLVAALTPLFRLDYCFAVRRTLRCVTTAAPTAHCAPPPSLDIYSFCSSLQDRYLLLSSAHPRFDFRNHVTRSTVSLNRGEISGFNQKIFGVVKTSTKKKKKKKTRQVKRGLGQGIVTCELEAREVRWACTRRWSASSGSSAAVCNVPRFHHGGTLPTSRGIPLSRTKRRKSVGVEVVFIFPG